jgi:hypothetical protein
MRFPAATALFSAILLLLGTAVAHADPSFTLTRSAAKPGEAVSFSISGTESRATYDVEVGDREVAGGSVPAGSRVSGAFTMPDLGRTSRTVTVEAQITETDETTTVTRSLQYLAPSQATGPTATGPAPAGAPAAVVQGAPAAGPTSSAPARKRRASKRPAGKRRRAAERRRAEKRRAAAKRRASPAPTPTQEPRSIEPPASTRGGNWSPGFPSPVSTPPINVSAPYATQRATGEEGKPDSTGRSKDRQPSEPGGKFTLGLTTPLTIPFAASGPASEVANNGTAAPITALVILALLSLMALALARAQRSGDPVGPQGWEVDDADDEVLRGFVYIPRGPRE